MTMSPPGASSDAADFSAPSSPSPSSSNSPSGEANNEPLGTFMAWSRRVVAAAAARRAGEQQLTSSTVALAKLHDELAGLKAAPAVEATKADLESLDSAIRTIDTHLHEMLEQVSHELVRDTQERDSCIAKMRFEWRGERLSARDAVDRWGSYGPRQYATLPLNMRTDIHDAAAISSQEDLSLPSDAKRGFDSRRAAEWRLAVDPVSSAAVLEARHELERRTVRRLRIRDEIGQWLPIVASHSSLLTQFSEGALHRRDAIAELEQWLWTRNRAKWTIHTNYRPATTLRQLNSQGVEYEPTDTISPEAYRVVQELREHIAHWPDNIGGVPSRATLQPGYCIRKAVRVSNSFKTNEVVTYSAEVHGTVGELSFKWLVDLEPPCVPVVDRPRERPEVVLIQQDGATNRIVTNIARLLVRVVDAEGPEEARENWITLPNESHAVYVGRREPEYDPAFVNLIRAHGPQKSNQQ